MALTRDDLKFSIGLIGGVAVGMAGSFNLFPWIPPTWQHGIGIVAFVYSIVSGKLATSPLPGRTVEAAELPVAPTTTVVVNTK